MKKTLIAPLLLVVALATACGDSDNDDAGPDSPGTPVLSDNGNPEAPGPEETEPADVDLPPSTVEDWTGFITDAGGTNGVDYAVDQLTDAIACLPEDPTPTCMLAAMSSQFFAQEVEKSFTAALGEGNTLTDVEPIGAPPAEISDLVTRTRDAAGSYNDAVRTVTGVAGGEDCKDSIEGNCASLRSTAREAGEELLTVMGEWEPHRN